MSGVSIAVKNRVVAGGLVGFVGLTYSYTMYRMKASTASIVEEFSSNTPARDAGK